MKKYFCYSLVVFTALCISCKKNQLGGKSTITGAVKHHTKIIANATIFIKFKAKDFPGTDTTLYDTKVKADVDGNYVINCYKGDYYLFGYGYDYALPPPYIVKGGTPVSIRNKENVVIELAVTE